MTFRHLRPLALLSVVSLAVACGEDPLPPPQAPPPPPPVAVAPAPPPALPPAPPPEPTAEEKKKAQEAKELEEDRAKFAKAKEDELARWTPDMHAAAKKLAETSFPTGHAAIQAAMAGTHRRPGNAARDVYRHPLEMMDFLGFKPTMTVVEVGPGEGWFTELLAPALAKKGKLYVTSGDPNGPADMRRTLYAQRLRGFLDTSPELYGKVQPIVLDGKAPQLGLDKTADMVLLLREVHGMVEDHVFGLWLTEANKALKVGGILAIEDHRALADANPDETAKKGYVPEKWVIDQVTAAGFKLAGKSEMNANAKDTKDYPEGVWSLPPTYREKDKNHEKYAAIGESDRMTLKFVKQASAK
jgi:predicted methyltransferase